MRVEFTTHCPRCGRGFIAVGGMTETSKGFEWDGTTDITVTCDRNHTFIVDSFELQRSGPVALTLGRQVV